MLQAVRQTHQRWDEARIFVDRATEVGLRLLVSGWRAPEPLLPSAKIEIVGLDVAGALDGQTLARRQLELELLGDRLRDLILNCEDIFDDAVVAF